MMDVIVVTGGIGSGKSEVCSILQNQYGCGVYEADSRVKALYVTHPTLLSDIEDVLDEKFRDDQGRFVPQMLSRRIFADRKALEEVEKLIFPALIEDFEHWKQAYADDRFIIFESATILEKPYFKGFGDKTILIDAPYEIRLERACCRDGSSRESVSARMSNQDLMNQISEGKVAPDVDAIIYNYDGVDELRHQIVLTINELYGNKTDIN